MSHPPRRIANGGRCVASDFSLTYNQTFSFSFFLTSLSLYDFCLFLSHCFSFSFFLSFSFSLLISLSSLYLYPSLTLFLSLSIYLSLYISPYSLSSLSCYNFLYYIYNLSHILFTSYFVSLFFLFFYPFLFSSIFVKTLDNLLGSMEPTYYLCFLKTLTLRYDARSRQQINLIFIVSNAPLKNAFPNLNQLHLQCIKFF